jgi:hypothetical protein
MSLLKRPRNHTLRQMSATAEVRSKLTASNATLVAMKMKIQQMDQQQSLNDLAGRMELIKSAIATDTGSDDFVYEDATFEPLLEAVHDDLGLTT